MCASTHGSFCLFRSCPRCRSIPSFRRSVCRALPGVFITLRRRDTAPCRHMATHAPVARGPPPRFAPPGRGPRPFPGPPLPTVAPRLTAGLRGERSRASPRSFLSATRGVQDGKCSIPASDKLCFVPVGHAQIVGHLHYAPAVYLTARYASCPTSVVAAFQIATSSVRLPSFGRTI